MSSGSRGPQQLRDRIVQARVYRQRDQFIASIGEKRVCELASSHRNGDRCRHFKNSIRGSYNICYFTEFDDGERWVVRVPLAPCLAFGARNKLESEIATMSLIAKNTTIPIPKIVAYSLADDPDPLSSFLILEYVEGQKLSYARLKSLSEEQRTHLYTSLADIHVQLRRLEFPSIGCLTCNRDGSEVSKETVSIDINMQELEGLQPSKIQAFYYDTGFLTSADKYTAMLLEIADNAFVKSRSVILEDEDEGKDRLYHLDIFRQYAENWVDNDFDQGPFVLVHGDLEPFNLVVNEDMDIISVLDWEWSRVVPLQFFKPPLWLETPDTTNLAYNFVYQDYLKRFNQFHTIVRNREYERYKNELLADEWEKAKVDSGFLVANALENWTDIDWFAFRYIDWKCYRGIDVSQRVEDFSNENPSHKALIDRKLHEGVAYKAEVDRLKEDTLKATAGRNHTLASTSILENFSLCRLFRNDTNLSLLPPVPKLVLGCVAMIIAGTSLYLLDRRLFRLSFLHRSY